MNTLNTKKMTAGSFPALEVRDLGQVYATESNEVAILKSLNLSVAQDEFVCVVGPSGVGKTTLLRCLAGLQRPTTGEVLVGNIPLKGPTSEVGIVFQDYSRSLMPWLTVLANVALPLRSRFKKKERNLRAEAALAEVGLADAGQKYPWQLSGGMQQRVAIARGLVFEPQVLLMDEPFASVDAQTREELEDLVLRVRRESGQSIILITHDIDEAIYLADRIVVLGGRPASVRAELDVPFGPDRNQLKTKAEPEFADLRRKIHRLIAEGTVNTVFRR